MNKVHYSYRNRPLCGIRASGQHYSRQITSVKNERAVTCHNCQRLLRQTFIYEGAALFDEEGEMFFASASATRAEVKTWALKRWPEQTWPQILKAGHRIERIIVQRVQI
jgi:hypothetical protein